MSPGLEPVVTGILDGIIGRLQESISKVRAESPVRRSPLPRPSLRAGPARQ